MNKAEIKSYRYYIKYRLRLNSKLDEVWYELTGVKGIRYDKAHMTVNPSVSSERKLMLLDMIDWYEKEIDRVNTQIESISNALKQMDEQDRELIYYTLIEGHTYRQAEAKFYLSRSAIAKRIDKILKEDTSTIIRW